MNSDDLGHLRYLINNLINFSIKHSNTLNKDSAPLWYYTKEKYNVTLDAVLLNDAFHFLSFLGLRDDEISDDELKFINYVFGLNFTKEDLLNYLNTNLPNDFSESLPSSFIYFYEFDKYMKDKGIKSQMEIVESLYGIFNEIGLAFIEVDNIESERIAFDSYMETLRKHLDDLKKVNYSLMIMALNGDLLNDRSNSSISDASRSIGDLDISKIDPSSPDVLMDKLNAFFKNNTYIDLGDIFKGDSDSPIGDLGINRSAYRDVLEGGSKDFNYSDIPFNSSDSNDVIDIDLDDSNKEENPNEILSDSDSLNQKQDGSQDDSDSQREIQEELNSQEEPGDEESLEDVLEKLNKLVGLETVKNDVNSLINLIQIRKIREERGIKQPDMSLHLVFSGNPGTGKTTVARLLSNIYCKLGLLSKGHLVETDRSGLVAGYVGQTAIKTQDMIKEAMGGILFIDEAYSLSSSKGENDFGGEAIDTILKAMEDNREDFIVIVAGYPDLMDEFLHSNPGLESRFNKHLFFEDYTPKELFDIFISMADESSLKLDKKAETFLKGHFEDIYESRGDNFANGRYVRNLFEKVLSKQANRLVDIEEISDEELNTLVLDDFDGCVD